MTISMYQALIPMSIRTLNNLINILEKGAAYAETKKQMKNLILIKKAVFQQMALLT